MRSSLIQGLIGLLVIFKHNTVLLIPYEVIFDENLFHIADIGYIWKQVGIGRPAEKTKKPR